MFCENSANILQMLQNLQIRPGLLEALLLRPPQLDGAPRVLRGRIHRLQGHPAVTLQSVGSETENLNVGGIENQQIKRFNFHGWDAKLKFQTEIGTFKIHHCIISTKIPEIPIKIGTCGN